MEADFNTHHIKGSLVCFITLRRILQTPCHRHIVSHPSHSLIQPSLLMGLLQNQVDRVIGIKDSLSSQHDILS